MSNDWIKKLQGRDPEEEERIRQNAEQAEVQNPQQPQEEGLEEEDWMDYIQPIRSIFKNPLRVAGAMAGKSILSKMQDKGAPKAVPVAKSITYNGGAFRPTQTRTDATTGWKDSPGIKVRD